MKKIKCYFLERSLNGTNFINESDLEEAEVKKLNFYSSPGILKFYKFLEENRLNYHGAMLELAQVLKVPCKKMQELGEASEADLGFISVDAATNIQEYLKNRVTPNSIAFLSSQQGEAGKLNTIRE